ncbi:hypothetical protein HDV00_003236 [Rhizophlyctis rosea]|nr:hypothetical protein HDV00_003236 [Rhizophlyctis rosea]
MELIESLGGTAASLYAKGQAKDAYEQHLRAANAILLSLASGVAWNGNDAVKKPDTAQHLFQLAHQHLTRAEEILNSKYVINVKQPNVGNALGSSHFNAISQPFPERIPRVPLSTLQRQLIKHSYQLTIAEQKYLAAQHSMPEPSLPVMRRLVEDLRMERSRVEDLTAKAQSVATKPIYEWEPESLALQIACLDANLFMKVRPRDDLIHHEDSENLHACLDFRRFLERITIDAILSNPSYAHCTVSVVVSTAYILLYAYRDLNGLAALLGALSTPHFTRLRKIWESIPPKTKDVLRHLESIFGLGSGQDHIQLVRDLLRFHYKGGGVLGVIPYLQPMVDEIKDINSAYQAGFQGAGIHGGKQTAVLSDIGVRAQEEVVALVELCQGVGRRDAQVHLETTSDQSSGTKKADKLSGTPSFEKATPTSPEDLGTLGDGDVSVGHWILTRVYWSQRELWAKSCELEPVKSGEAFQFEHEEVTTSLSQPVPIAIPLIPTPVLSSGDIQSLVTPPADVSAEETGSSEPSAVQDSEREDQHPPTTTTSVAEDTSEIPLFPEIPSGLPEDFLRSEVPDESMDDAEKQPGEEHTEEEKQAGEELTEEDRPYAEVSDSEGLGTDIEGDDYLDSAGVADAMQSHSAVGVTAEEPSQDILHGSEEVTEGGTGNEEESSHEPVVSQSADSAHAESQKEESDEPHPDPINDLARRLSELRQQPKDDE